MGIGEWLNGHALPLESLPSGGRKTTGYAQTEPLQVLYNGLREFTVLSVTHLYDWANANEDGVVQHPCSKTQLLGRTRSKIFSYLFCNIRTTFDVPSGLESSITRMQAFNLKLSISSINFSMFAASQYVGKIIPTSEFT